MEKVEYQVCIDFGSSSAHEIKRFETLEEAKRQYDQSGFRARKVELQKIIVLKSKQGTILI